MSSSQPSLGCFSPELPRFSAAELPDFEGRAHPTLAETKSIHHMLCLGMSTQVPLTLLNTPDSSCKSNIRMKEVRWTCYNDTSSQNPLQKRWGCKNRSKKLLFQNVLVSLHEAPKLWCWQLPVFNPCNTERSWAKWTNANSGRQKSRNHRMRSKQFARLVPTSDWNKMQPTNPNAHTNLNMVQMSKHMDMQSRRTLFCNSLLEQYCKYFPCYQSAVWSGKCRVWGVECGV